jgi:hypothetical protein
MYKLIVGNGPGNEWTHLSNFLHSRHENILDAFKEVLRVQYEYPLPEGCHEKTLNVHETKTAKLLWSEVDV